MPVSTRGAARPPFRLRPLPVLLTLALLHGGLYATLLPPWGLIDEEHHFHYVQHLAETGAIPVVGQTFLSPDLVASLFATRRWEMFHWVTPASSDPRTWGLEGHSYEGYQPPLFYALLAPVYRLLPGGVLVKLYALRWLLVGLSLLPVWIGYRLTEDLFPKAAGLPAAAGLLLALLPERVMAVSRVNNDALLEVWAAGFIWVWTRAVLEGLTIRRGQALGLLLGLGLLTKLSIAPLAVLLPLSLSARPRAAANWRSLAWAALIPAVLVAPWLLRNWQLYGDPTGFAAFERLRPALGVALTPASLLAAASDLFRHFWVLWWQGAAVGTHPVLKGLYAVVLAAAVLAEFGAARHLWAVWRAGQAGRRTRIGLCYAIAIGVFAVAVTASYFGGAVPVIQGRLLLPVIVPICVGLAWAWRQLGRLGAGVLAATVAALTTMSLLSLFGNLLPYFYYHSAFVLQGVAQPTPELGWGAAWQLFASRLASDKPAGLRPLLPLLPALFGVWLAVAVPRLLPFVLGTARDQHPAA